MAYIDGTTGLYQSGSLYGPYLIEGENAGSFSEYMDTGSSLDMNDPSESGHSSLSLSIRSSFSDEQRVINEQQQALIDIYNYVTDLLNVQINGPFEYSLQQGLDDHGIFLRLSSSPKLSGNQATAVSINSGQILDRFYTFLSQSGFENAVWSEAVGNSGPKTSQETMFGAKAFTEARIEPQQYMNVSPSIVMTGQFANHENPSQSDMLVGHVHDLLTVGPEEADVETNDELPDVPPPGRVHDGRGGYHDDWLNKVFTYEPFQYFIDLLKKDYGLIDPPKPKELWDSSVGKKVKYETSPYELCGPGVSSMIAGYLCKDGSKKLQKALDAFKKAKTEPDKLIANIRLWRTIFERAKNNEDSEKLKHQDDVKLHAFVMNCLSIKSNWELILTHNPNIYVPIDFHPLLLSIWNEALAQQTKLDQRFQERTNNQSAKEQKCLENLRMLLPINGIPLTHNSSPTPIVCVK